MTTTVPRVIRRYATVGGAPVLVLRHQTRACTDGAGQVRDCTWRCLGCDAPANDPWVDQDAVEVEAEVQATANQHAEQCHAVPAGEVELSAMRAELTGIRHELANVAEAVRELASTVDETLLDVANAISDRPDPSEGLADIATVVESLVIQMVERPRRRWRKRLLAGCRADEAVPYWPAGQEESEEGSR